MSELIELPQDTSTFLESSTKQETPSHGQSHGHSHGGEACEGHGMTKQQEMFYTSIGYSIMMWGLIFNDLMIIYCKLTTLYTGWDRLGFLWGIHGLLMMVLVCFYVTYKTDNNQYQKSCVDHEKEIFRRTYRKLNVCEPCNTVKSGRFNHCSVCEKCLVRMDHHCPWMWNCVAWRNHKSFFLFLVYAIFLCGYFLFASGDYIYTFYYSGVPHKDSQTFQLYLILSCIITWLFAAFVLALIKQHYYTACHGVTTVDLIKESTAKGQGREGVERWYDMGVTGNLFNFFDQRMFLFWFPTRNYLMDDGYGFPINPLAPLSEHKKYFILKKPTIEYESEVETFSSQKYNFQFNGKIYN